MVIKSISYDQHEIIKNIISLYCSDGIELDTTYSKGLFYKKGIFIKAFSKMGDIVLDPICWVWNHLFISQEFK